MFFFLSLLFCVSAAAQEIGGDTLKPAGAVEGYTMSRSPLGAVLRSAAVPGWGQFYNEAYWKVPLVLGLGAFLVRGVIVEHNSFVEYRDSYAASITPANMAGDLRLKQFREFYRDNRDSYAWWFLVLYLVQIADAFVDAHLFDFDVSDSISGRSLPSDGSRLSIAIRF